MIGVLNIGFDWGANLFRPLAAGMPRSNRRSERLLNMWKSAPPDSLGNGTNALRHQSALPPSRL